MAIYLVQREHRGRGKNPNCLINYSLHEIMTKPRYPQLFCNSQKKEGKGGWVVGGGGQPNETCFNLFSQIDIMLQERETKKKRAEENRSGRVKTKKTKRVRG